MPNISKLPLYVLENILLYTVDNCFNYLENWKRLIPLVGVCKKWTYILRPVVFSTAFINCDLYKIHGGWETNVDCIAIRGWYSSVKIMNICIKLPVNSMLVLNKLQSILQLNTINWTRISQLVIYFDDNESRRPTNYSDNLNTRVVDFTCKLISKMPNIIGLRFCQLYRTNFLQKVLLLLVNAYSAQMQLLDIMPIINNPTTHLGSNLAYLSLGFDNIFRSYIMSICAEPLRELCLTNAPVELPWHIFHGYSEPGHINFKSLRKLYIAFGIHNYNNQSNTQVTNQSSFALVGHVSNSTSNMSSLSNNTYTYKLLFPKLRELNIKNFPYNVDYFNAKFGCTLKTVKLLGALQRILKWVNIPQSSQQLDMQIFTDKGLTATENTNTLNELLNATTRCQYRSLYLMIHSDYIHLSLVTWGNLNELAVSNVEIADILALLSKTPQLKKIAVNFIELNDYYTIDKVEQLFRQRVDTRQFALVLKTLVIRDIKGTYDENIALAVIYNLMTRAKMLSQIAVSKKFVEQMMMIIDAQKEYYPHFSKMHVFTIK